VRKAITPRGEARADWEIICDLAQRIESRLGGVTGAAWVYTGPEQVFREMAGVVDGFAGITYQRLDQGGLQYPVPDVNHPGTPFLFADSFPAGRGRFFPLEHVPVAEEADEEYPFILTTGRLLEHWHGGTMTRHSQLDALYPEAYVEMHEIDAARCHLATGDRVEVASRRGAIELRVLVSPRTTPGVVFIPMHFVEAAANVLTIDVLDPEAKIPEFKACAVKIEIKRPAGAQEEAQIRGRY
jgi:predicted molibdopterin-dependent oxidoreductase YjgC